MTLQINFVDPSAISFDLRDPDRMKITFIEPGLFRNRDTGLKLLPDQLVQIINVEP